MAKKKKRKLVGTPTGKFTYYKGKPTGRQVYKTSKGENVSEKSTTFPIYRGRLGEYNKFVNAPTIYDGVKYSSDEVQDMYENKKIKATSEHKTQEEAIKAAEERSKNLTFKELDKKKKKLPPPYTKVYAYGGRVARYKKDNARR